MAMVWQGLGLIYALHSYLPRLKRRGLICNQFPAAHQNNSTSAARGFANLRY